MTNDLELLFVDVKSIKRYNVPKNYQYHIVTNLTRGVALDYDIRTGRVFYTDVTENLIYSSRLCARSKEVTHLCADSKHVTEVRNRLIVIAVIGSLCCIMWNVVAS